MENPFNIFLIGVGGQGIGLISEVIARAADNAGIAIHGADTHGLAQRGGSVSSFIRLGDKAHSPLIMRNHAHLVIGLELHEALRGCNEFLMDKGTLICYNASWQPLSVRLGQAEAITLEMIEKECLQRNITLYPVFKDDLPDSIMQNIVVLASLVKYNLIPSLTKENYINAMKDILPLKTFNLNISLFEEVLQS
ncbi:MAG: 2-oxoacid:acceptor oxidoreductase family protein [Bacteroidota bacterium]